MSSIIRRRLWAHIALLCLMLSGCVNVTTTTVRRDPDGAVRVSSGKDVHFDKLIFQEDPHGGTVTLVVHGYSSNASVDAINAQAQREQQVITGVLKAVEIGARGAVVP